MFCTATATTLHSIGSILFCAVPDAVRQTEAVLLQRQAAESGKPEKVLGKMVLGRLNKFYQDVCLMEQVPALKGDCKCVWQTFTWTDSK